MDEDPNPAKRTPTFPPSPEKKKKSENPIAKRKNTKFLDHWFARQKKKGKITFSGGGEASKRPFICSGKGKGKRVESKKGILTRSKGGPAMVEGKAPKKNSCRKRELKQETLSWTAIGGGDMSRGTPKIS